MYRGPIPIATSNNTYRSVSGFLSGLSPNLLVTTFCTSWGSMKGIFTTYSHSLLCKTHAYTCNHPYQLPHLMGNIGSTHRYPLIALVTSNYLQGDKLTVNV